MTALTQMRIAAEADDGYEASGSFTNTGTIYCDNATHAGFSFTLSGTIPAGATIDSCYLQVYCAGGTGDITLKIRLDADVDPATAVVWSNTHLITGVTSWATANGNTVITPAVSWFFGSGDSGATNLKDDLQALVTSYGELASGQRLNFALVWQSGGYLELTQYSETITRACLDISYTEGGGASIGGALNVHVRKAL